MTEKEKMLAGLGYNAYDDELIQDRVNAKELCRQALLLQADKIEERQKIYRELFKADHEEFEITPPFFCDYGYNIKIGKKFYTNYNCVILDCTEVIIGDNVLFGPNVQVYTATHPVEAAPRSQGVEMAYPIKIGNNVWVGGNTVICPGVTIGDNAVIGAGSVVTKDIPADVVAVGNPCKVLKKIENGDEKK